MSRWDPRDVVAIIVAAGVSISMAVLCLDIIIRNVTLSHNAQAWLASVIGALVGSVATYLGGNIYPRKKGRSDDDRTDRT